MEFNGFIEKKYRSYFRFLDITKQGFISEDTFIKICESLCRAYKADENAVQRLKEEVPKWWTFYEPLAEGGKITEQLYIDTHRSFFSDLAHLKTYSNNITQASRMIFDMIDTNKDSKISIYELRKYYSGFGCTDEEFLEKVFRNLDTDGNGSISKEEYVDVYLKYFCSNDSNSKGAFLFDWSNRNQN